MKDRGIRFRVLVVVPVVVRFRNERETKVCFSNKKTARSYCNRAVGFCRKCPPLTPLFSPEAQSRLDEFLADFGKARNAKVFTFEHVVGGSSDEFADCRQSQSCHALSGTY